MNRGAAVHRRCCSSTVFAVGEGGEHLGVVFTGVDGLDYGRGQRGVERLLRLVGAGARPLTIRRHFGACVRIFCLGAGPASAAAATGAGDAAPEPAPLQSALQHRVVRVRERGTRC